MTQSNEHYQEVKLTIDLVKANVFALALMFPIFLLYGIPYYLCWSEQFSLAYLVQFFSKGIINPLWNALLTIIVFLVGIVAHELIHGFVWALFAKNGFHSIKFGIMWQMLTPYCHCKEPMQIKQYLLGAIMPAIVLGLLPTIYAIAFGSLGWLAFGFFFTSAAAGDFMIVYLLRNENPTDLVQDHPSEAGCFVYRKTK